MIWTRICGVIPFLLFLAEARKRCNLRSTCKFKSYKSPKRHKSRFDFHSPDYSSSDDSFDSEDFPSDLRVKDNAWILRDGQHHLSQQPMRKHHGSSRISYPEKSSDPFGMQMPTFSGSSALTPSSFPSRQYHYNPITQSEEIVHHGYQFDGLNSNQQVLSPQNFNEYDSAQFTSNAISNYGISDLADFSSPVVDWPSQSSQFRYPPLHNVESNSAFSMRQSLYNSPSHLDGANSEKRVGTVSPPEHFMISNSGSDAKADEEYVKTMVSDMYLASLPKPIFSVPSRSNVEFTISSDIDNSFISPISELALPHQSFPSIMAGTAGPLYNTGYSNDFQTPALQSHTSSSNLMNEPGYSLKANTYSNSMNNPKNSNLNFAGPGNFPSDLFFLKYNAVPSFFSGESSLELTEYPPKHNFLNPHLSSEANMMVSGDLISQPSFDSSMSFEENLLYPFQTFNPVTKIPSTSTALISQPPLAKESSFGRSKLYPSQPSISTSDSKGAIHSAKNFPYPVEDVQNIAFLSQPSYAPHAKHSITIDGTIYIPMDSEASFLKPAHTTSYLSGGEIPDRHSDFYKTSEFAVPSPVAYKAVPYKLFEGTDYLSGAVMYDTWTHPYESANARNSFPSAIPNLQPTEPLKYNPPPALQKMIGTGGMHHKPVDVINHHPNSASYQTAGILLGSPSNAAQNVAPVHLGSFAPSKAAFPGANDQVLNHPFKSKSSAGFTSGALLPSSYFVSPTVNTPILGASNLGYYYMPSKLEPYRNTPPMQSQAVYAPNGHKIQVHGGHNYYLD